MGNFDPIIQSNRSGVACKFAAAMGGLIGASGSEHTEDFYGWPNHAYE